MVRRDSAEMEVRVINSAGDERNQGRRRQFYWGEKDPQVQGKERPVRIVRGKGGRESLGSGGKKESDEGVGFAGLKHSCISRGWRHA